MAVKASEYVLAMSVPYCPVVVLDISRKLAAIPVGELSFVNKQRSPSVWPLAGRLSDFGSCHKTSRVKWLRRKCCKKVVFSQNIVQIPSGSLNSATRDGRINCGGNVPMFKLKPSPMPGFFRVVKKSLRLLTAYFFD